MNSDTNNIVAGIDKSPLSSEDKNHWKQLLPRMNEAQKKRLHHSLSVKTQANKAMQLIQQALDIIDKAEAEAEVEETTTEEKKEEIRQQIETTATTKTPGEKITLRQEDLQKMHQEEQNRLEEMREELKKLSQETHGSEPPSYQN